MSEFLEYGWLFTIMHGGADLRFRKYRLFVCSKPIIGFYKPPLEVWWDWFMDTIRGRKEKDLHRWQQSLTEALHFVNFLCPEGGIVCDPMCGSGTTCLAAKEAGRHWIGFDQDENAVNDARLRIA